MHHWVQVLQQLSLDLCLRSLVHLLVLQPFCVCKGICLDCITALESATSFEKHSLHVCMSVFISGVVFVLLLLLLLLLLVVVCSGCWSYQFVLFRL